MEGRLRLVVYAGGMREPDTPPADSAPLRADAERNRARILDTARRVYAEQGLDIPLTDIARQAGVGIATLYRRFPTGEDLIAAAFAAKMEAYAAAAEEALEAEDPWTGFSDYIRTVCQMQATDAGFADILALTPRETFAAQRSRAFRALTRLIRRAQDAGAMRTDFVHQDIPLLLMANAGLVRATGGNLRASARFTEFMLQACRARDGAPLPAAPTPREVFTALQRGNLTTNE